MGEQIAQLFQYVLQLEVDLLDVEFAGFDLGEIEDVVDEIE